MKMNFLKLDLITDEVATNLGYVRIRVCIGLSVGEICRR